MTWLGRWRIDGINWEGRAWYLSPGGVTLARALNVIWPQSHAADGTVASKAHDQNNPSSDHRPYPYDASPAVVRALDAGEAIEGDGQELFDMLLVSRDPRIKYVLHENKIFSSYSRSHRDAWEVKTGTYGHPNHVHISFTELADIDDSTWNLGGHMAHVHNPMPDDLPRSWADETWAAWVARSGTDPASRTWDFYREDLSWVYTRVIEPLERKIGALEARLAVAEKALANLELGGISRAEYDAHRHSEGTTGPPR